MVCLYYYVCISSLINMIHNRIRAYEQGWDILLILRYISIIKVIMVISFLLMLQIYRLIPCMWTIHPYLNKYRLANYTMVQCVFNRILFIQMIEVGKRSNKPIWLSFIFNIFNIQCTVYIVMSKLDQHFFYTT